jgi:hypothetical protein
VLRYYRGELLKVQTCTYQTIKVLAPILLQSSLVHSQLVKSRTFQRLIVVSALCLAGLFFLLVLPK